VSAGCSEVIRGSVRIDEGFRRRSQHSGNSSGRIGRRETRHCGLSVFSIAQICPRLLDQKLIGAGYLGVLASAVRERLEL
jgi:hypothetical protein